MVAQVEEIRVASLALNVEAERRAVQLQDEVLSATSGREIKPPGTQGGRKGCTRKPWNNCKPIWMF